MSVIDHTLSGSCQMSFLHLHHIQAYVLCSTVNPCHHRKKWQGMAMIGALPVLQQVSNHHTSLGATQNATDIDVSSPMEFSSPANGSIGYNTYSSSYEALRPQTALLTHYLCVQSGFGRFVRHPATLRRSDSAQTCRKARLT